MREIKFRAWDSENKKMLDWEHLRGYCDIDYLFGGAYERDKGHPYPYPIAMQYTGLKDKNGREIYEGDVYQYFIQGHFGGFYKEIESLDVVRWEDGAFWVGDYLLFEALEGDDESEVIGNIYENPGLLEEVEE